MDGCRSTVCAGDFLAMNRVSCGGSAWQNGAGPAQQMKTSGKQQDDTDKHLQVRG